MKGLQELEILEIENQKSEQNALETDENTQTEFVSGVVEEELDKSQTLGVIKGYFTPQSPTAEIKEMAEIFGQSEGEITREFGSYKAKKLYLKMDYMLSDNGLNKQEIIKKINLVLRYGFNSVTVMPNFISLAKYVLSGSNLGLRALISYPYGEDIFKSKKYAVKKAFALGADSVIISVSASAVKNGEFKVLAKEFKKFVKMAGNRKVYALLDCDSLNLAEMEKFAKETVAVAKIYAIILSTKLFKGKISLETLKALLVAVDGKCFIDCGGEIKTPEETVTALTFGANCVTSQNCVEIAENLNRRISADINL